MKSVGLLLALAGLGAFSAQAAQINGDVGFTGTYTQDGTPGNLTTATAFTITSVEVNTSNGDLAGATNPVFLSPVPNNAAGLIGQQLWSVDVGLNSFNLIVNTATKVTNTAQTIVFQGTGTMADTNGDFDPTPGSWQLSFGVSGSSLTWQSTANSVPQVPEGGYALMMLGAAMAGLAAVRRFGRFN